MTCCTSGLWSVYRVVALCSMFFSMCCSMDHTQTYKPEINGISMTCDMCKPGEKFVSHCTKDGGSAQCIPCPIGTFNTHFTIAKECAPCGTQCKDTERQEIEKNCTSTANMSCICRDGLYQVATGICIAQTACGPGYGVKQKGDRYSKTVCETCNDGYFSNVTSLTEPCMICSTCGSGEVELTACTSHNDTVCVMAKQKEKEKDNLALKVGLPIGIIAFLIVIAIVVLCCFRPHIKCIERCKKFKSKTVESDVLLNGLNTGSCFTDAELRDLAGDLTFPDYQFFFRELIEHDADKLINEKYLNHQHLGIKEVTYQILFGWREKEKDNATKQKVIKAFRNVHKNVLADKYSEMWTYTNGHSEGV